MLQMCGDITLPRTLTIVSDRSPLKSWKTSCAQFALKFKFVVSVMELPVSLGCRWSRSVWTGWMSSHRLLAMRAGKAICVDSIPPEACRVAGKAYWCQLAEIVKQVIKCNRFPDVWKGGIMCGIPRKPRAPSTPEHSRGILISTAPSTLVGKVLNKRITQAVEATSKSRQIGCRPGRGTEFPSLITTEFLAMCKQQQRPAAILFADLKGAFYHALLVQVVGPYISEADLRTCFPGWSEEDRREHVTRAMAKPLRAAGVSKAWTDLLRQWFTGGLVPGGGRCTTVST